MDDREKLMLYYDLRTLLEDSGVDEEVINEVWRMFEDTVAHFEIEKKELEWEIEDCEFEWSMEVSHLEMENSSLREELEEMEIELERCIEYVKSLEEEGEGGEDE